MKAYVNWDERCIASDNKCPYYCDHNGGCTLMLVTGDTLNKMIEELGEYDCEEYRNAKHNSLEIKRTLEVIEAEINFYKTQTASGIIEIGKRLIEAKEQIRHGEWGKWLEEKVEVSQWTANKFMRVANELSNCGTFNNLPQSKVFMLLDVPADEREDFIENNPVDEMTARELRQVIKEKKDLEKRLRESEDSFYQANTKNNKLTQEIEKLTDEEAYLKQRLIEKDETVKKIIALRPEKIIEKEVMPEDYETTKSENERLKEQNQTLLEQKQQIARQLQENKTLDGDIINLSEFQINIGYFLDKMAKYTYYAEAFSLIEKRYQTEFAKQVDKIEIWCIEMRQAIKGEKTEKSIIIEGGYRVE